VYYNLSQPPFLKEQALIYSEMPDCDFSNLNISTYDFADDLFEEYIFGGYNYEFGEDFVFETPFSYDIDLIKLQKDIKKFIDEPNSTFSQNVLEIIRLHDKDEIAVYKRAHLDRKIFSKLRSNIHYQPSRNTAIALAFALELNFSETQALLKKAGYALSHTTVSDLIIEYFILNGIYSIVLLNEMLYTFGQPVIFN